MRDQEVFAALNQHRAASDSGDFAAEHDIYQEDAVLDYPQSRERIVGRQSVQITRSLPPSKKRFSIMEFRWRGRERGVSMQKSRRSSRVKEHRSENGDRIRDPGSNESIPWREQIDGRTIQSGGSCSLEF
jgi:hypothetical protein